MTASYAKSIQLELERELISSPPESFELFVLLSRDVTALDREISSFTTFLTNGCIVIIIIIIIYSQLRDAFLVSNCSFLFLTVYKCVNFCHDGSFHNTECGNKGNKLKSWLLLSLLSLFPSDCIGLAYGAVT